ncbi:MAG: His-Xaa-Ser system radical SAM maturase HxsB [Candidatus Omnitrophota bacterium]|nr:His-Xaa-Ser system radical SAM maturase HxsB [Candidatus Omnitrophota bacterium]
MSLDSIKLGKRGIGDFRFRRLGRQFLITNELGEYSFLDPRSFQSFISGGNKRLSILKLDELSNKGFIPGALNSDVLSYRYALRNRFLFSGPSLHIIVVTLRCDHRCIYCQASSRPQDGTGWDMDESTAAKVVDTILEGPSDNIAVEFQGGEPLLNFKTVKFIIRYARRENKTRKKKITFTLVSNFSHMDDEKLDYLATNDVSLCTSLDGPEELHNKHRITAGGRNSFRNTVKWIKKIDEKIKAGEYKRGINALATITRYSLRYPRRIVDEYVNLGLSGIHLRPVSPFGAGRSIINKTMGFTAREFMDFYKEAMRHILKINKKGKYFFERTAKIFLTKILSDNDENYMDLRSPCGAGVGQLAYNFNGDVYTCDEGRMLSAGPADEIFRLGNVKADRYCDLIDNPTVKSLCLASCLSNLPRCSDCAYKSYCGVCPVYNYAVSGNLFSRCINDKCRIQRSQLDYLFAALRTPARHIYQSWINMR